MTRVNEKAAFTLAEVLITLGIIGVVAAMTLPSLTAKYRSAAAITQLKKLHSIISQAMQRAVPEGDYSNIPVSGGGIEGVTTFYNEYLKPQFKISKECINDKNGCWAKTEDPAERNFSNSWGYGSGTISFTTSDGYNFSIDSWDKADYATINNWFGVDFNGTSNIMTVYVDANGSKKPNVLGKDVFIYVLGDKGLRPAGWIKTDEVVREECKSTGKFCLTNIIRNNWTINPEDAW